MSDDKTLRQILHLNGHYDHGSELMENLLKAKGLWSELMENLLKAKGLWSLVENGFSGLVEGT